MRRTYRPLCVAAVLGAGLVVAAPAAPLPGTQRHELLLASADAPLGDGIAFVMGGSGLATPGQAYADAVNALYLAPLGFTGTTQIVTTPEELYPFFGPFGGTLDKSLAQGGQALDDAIMAKFHAGELSSEHPAVVFGWSQSAIIASQVQSQLADQGVPSDDVRFVMIGDVSAPNGGLLERFNLPDNAQPSLPSLGITFSGAGPSDLYPTDVYTHEYDGFADFPQYPVNVLADLNALLGIAFEHTTYLGLTADQIGDAILLPTSAADTLTDYYMIPANGLPLLDPLLFFGSGGKAVYDLLEPDMRILVNLGYGSITDGWSQGDADVPTPLGFLPDSATLHTLAAQLPQALLDGWQQGVTAFAADLTHPDNTTPGFLTELSALTKIIPGTQLSEFFSTPTTAADLFDTFPPHTGIPALDIASAVLINLPQIDYSVFTSELADGNLLDAIGIPIAADLGILPLALLGALI
ncbi:PE-PPE domain-containing protein [Mycobacterium sp. M1]|uniref:PE-PPE domain-containing protein n=1 Tax=Mycolicibacter acidiphilus TaxID=2835306 RepID=A0ABS5RHN9_9MYCO|nr:PE-PPE domain-containing protein [Mycolicibacter acidiphilus]MBS9533815.1 PE-PPE domain-containing protein [Mycolicibacter acidiphilus]